jgi:hypothetical protein
MKFKQYLTRLLLIASGIVYIWAIISVGKISLSSDNTKELIEEGEVVYDAKNNPIIVDAEPPEVDEFFLTIISLIGTALAIHTGTVLNIKLDQNVEIFKLEENDSFLDKIKKFINNQKIIQWIWKIIKSIFTFDLKQMPEIATALYITGLVIGVYYFFREDRSPASAEILKTSWTSLLGLFAGVWSSNKE